jgi:hypothetical protein
VPRPRRFKAYRITSFYLPIEYEDITKKAEELMKVEGYSFSEMLLEALKEYVQNHYPGNPQTILPSHTDRALQPLRLKAHWSIRDLERDLGILKAKRGSAQYLDEVRKRAEKTVVDLSSINLTVKDSGIQTVIDKALEILEARI